MDARITIRLAAPSERAALEALQWRASLANEGDRDALLANPDAIVLPLAQIAAGQVFVAEDGDHLLGFAAVLDRDDGDTELDGLFVEPAAWKRGIGRLLVAACAGYARARGARALHVIANPHAGDFYARCRFAPMGVIQTQFGTGTVMRLAV
jgi:GNAT superfamily N-acetyltransferase